MSGQVSNRLSLQGRSLRVAVGLNRLWLAGAEINAVDLARAIQSKGHEVVLFAQEEGDMPMVEVAQRSGLAIRLLPREGSRRMISAVAGLISEERVDIVHAYYQRLGLAAYLGSGLRRPLPIVMTYYGMDPLRSLPPYSHLIVGTEALAIHLQRWYSSPVSVIEPPVDCKRDHPGAGDGASFLTRYALSPNSIRIVLVSRLERDMKLDGILRTIRSIGDLRGRNVDLIIVGSGDGFTEAQYAAAQVNERLGRRAILLTGRIPDPRGAYDCADIVIGMGGSALRAMAFGKPVIVVGEAGFSLPFEPETAGYFSLHGFYGEGPMVDLPMAISRLVADHSLRSRLGAFGLQTITSRYALEIAANRLENIYFSALDNPVTGKRRAFGATRSVMYAKSRRLRGLEDARRLYLDQKARVAEFGQSDKP